MILPRRIKDFSTVDEERRGLLVFYPSPSPPRKKFLIMKIAIGLAILCAIALTVASGDEESKGGSKEGSKEESKEGSKEESTEGSKEGSAQDDAESTTKGSEEKDKSDEKDEEVTEDTDAPLAFNAPTGGNATAGQTRGDTDEKRDIDCDNILDCDVARMISEYREIVTQIIDYVTVQQKGETWKQLAEFVDRSGPRFTGTVALEEAIDDRVKHLSEVIGEENVRTEPVTVPVWKRGETEVVLLNTWSGGRNKTLGCLTLGFSVDTPNEGITADVIVVRSFEELENLPDVEGKVVVFNQDFVSYPQTVIYRTAGASKAAVKGAVAVLIRSITDYSLYTPHTGMMTYEGNGTKIPAISITVEDAELMWRKQQRGEKLRVFIRSTARSEGTSTSRNIIAEIPGSVNPEEFVIVSGHIDSWDVGQGAMDDGGGAAISWRVLDVLRALKLNPRRTVKTLLFTGEELGFYGGQAYFEAHKVNASNAQFIMESDLGVFTPLGLSTATKNDKAYCMIERTLQLFDEINATDVRGKAGAPDVENWFDLGVPGASLYTDNEHYFRYHHTNADTMHMMMPNALDKATALWAGVAFIFADLEIRIPHDPPVHEAEPTGPKTEEVKADDMPAVFAADVPDAESSSTTTEPAASSSTTGGPDSSEDDDDDEEKSSGAEP